MFRRACLSRSDIDLAVTIPITQLNAILDPHFSAIHHQTNHEMLAGIFMLIRKGDISGAKSKGIIVQNFFGELSWRCRSEVRYSLPPAPAV